MILKKESNHNETSNKHDKINDPFAKTSSARLCRINSSERHLGFFLQGSTSNIGVFRIADVANDSPAYRSGLLNGEYLIEVCGVNVQSMDYTKVIELIKIGKQNGNLSLLVADKVTWDSYKIGNICL